MTWIRTIDEGAERVSTILESVLKLASIVLLILLSISTFLPTVLRYLTPKLPGWAGGELPSYLLTWIVAVGMALATRSGGHMRVNILQTLLPVRPRAVLQLVIDCIVFTFLIILATHFYNLAVDNIQTQSPMLRISLFWVHLSIAVGSVLSLIFILRHIVGNLRALLVDVPAETTGEGGGSVPAGEA